MDFVDGQGVYLNIFWNPTETRVLTLNQPPNKKSTIGLKFANVVDQMLVSIWLPHNSKDFWKWVHGFINLFPHEMVGINGFQIFIDFK